MKNFVLFFVFLFSAKLLVAQGDSLVVNPDFLSQLPPTVIPKFDNTRKSDYILYFPMKYAKFIFNDEEKKILQNISELESSLDELKEDISRSIKTRIIDFYNA